MKVKRAGLLGRLRDSVDFRARLTLGRFHERLCPIVQVEGIKVRVYPAFPREIKLALRWGYYELPELRLVASHLDQSDMVLEIGTGMGVVASFCAHLIGAERVYTFEANPALESHIQETFALNQIQPHFEMCLVGEREGDSDFFVSRNFWSSSIMARHDESLERKRVRGYRFNDMIRWIQPTFLIVDIEGGEYELFRYAEFPGVRKLLLELHEALLGDNRALEVLTRLRRAGFAVVDEASIGNRVLMLESDAN